MTRMWYPLRRGSRLVESRSRSRSSRPCVEFCEGRTLLSAVLWTGGAGTDDWDTAANWSTDSLPGAGDSVTIPAGATVVHSDSDSDAINGLSSSGTLSISGGTVEIGAASTTSALTVDGGTLTVNGSLDASGLLTLSAGGTLSGSGIVTAGAGIAIDPYSVELSGVTLKNAAGETATWTGGEVQIQNGAVFDNLGTFSIPAPGAGSSAFDGAWYATGAASSFDNAGTLIAASGATAGDCDFTVPFNSSGGTVEVQSGFLGLESGGTSTGGTFKADAGAELDLGAASGQTWALDTTSSIGGSGTVNFDGGGTITVNGTYDVTGATSALALVGGGSGVVNFDGSVESVGPALSVNEGTLNFITPFVGSAGTISAVEIGLSGTVNLGANDSSATTLSCAGILSGSGTTTVSGLLTLSGGTLKGGGIVDALGGMTIAGCTVNATTLVNAAGQTATLTEPSSAIADNIMIEYGGVFNNHGTFLAVDAGTISAYGTPASAFNNDGSLIQSTQGVVQFTAQFNSGGGTVDVQDGTLELDGGGTAAGSTFTVETGAELELSGTSTFDAASSIKGAGDVCFGQDAVAALTDNGTFDITGTTAVGAVIEGEVMGYDSTSVDLNGQVDSIGLSLSVLAGAINFNTPFVGSAGTIPTVLVASGGTLNFGANDSSATTLTCDGKMSGSGTVTVSGLLRISGGTLSGGGTVLGNGGITIDAATLNGATLKNAAGQTATWSGIGLVILEVGAVFDNLGTFSIPAPAAGSPAFDSYWYEEPTGASSSFDNSGSVIVSAGARDNDCYFDVPFSSSDGTVDVQNGFFGLEGGGTSTGGTFTAETGTELQIGGATGQDWTLDTSSSIGGAGTVNLQGDANITMNGTYDVTGTTIDLTASPTAGTSTATNFDGPVDSLGGSLLVESGTVNFNTAFVGNAGTIPNVDIGPTIASNGNGGYAVLNLVANDLTATALVDDGDLAGTGTVTVSGESTFGNADFGPTSEISGSCVYDADGGSTLATSLKLDGCTFNNPAGQTITPGADGGFLFSDGGVLNNLGTIDVTSEIPFGLNSSGEAQPDGSFKNEGTFIVNSPLDATAGNPIGEPISFENIALDDEGGSVQVQQGALVLDGGGTSPSGSFDVSAGATLQIDDDNDESYTFGAATTVSGAGIFTVLDDYLSQEGEVGGSVVTFAGTSTITGATTLASGTLQVDGSSSSSAVRVAPQIYATGVTLSGSGTVGPITTASSMTVGTPPYSVTTTDSNISPGDGALEPGILTALGNVTLNSVTNFDVALNGATAGTGYDQLNATGSVSLGGSTLNATLGFTPVSGNSFTIIQSTAPINGTFAGLAQGASLKIGGVSFTISYTGGSSGDDVVLTPEVSTTTPVVTSISLLSSNSVSSFGQTVTFTARVAAASGSSAPTGDVTFTIDGQPQTPVALTVVDGVDEATFSTSTLSVGPHTISVAYAGNGGFASSVLPSPATQNVYASTTTTLTSSSNPSNVGAPVTFTATVTGPKGAGTPTGSVTFNEAGTLVGPITLDSAGQATVTTSSLPVGSTTIDANYSPTGDFATDQTEPSLTQVVNGSSLPATTTQVTSSASTVTLGQPVTLTAVVSNAGSGTPGGDVTFTIDGRTQTPVALAVANGVDEASFSTSTLSFGQHTITAAYGGDTSFGPSAPSSPLTVSVDAPTTMALTSSSNTSLLGQSVTFTAILTAPTGAGTPTGSVTLSEGGKVLFTSPVSSSGKATFTTSALAVGTYAVTAAYTPSGDYIAGPFQTVTQVVTPAVNTQMPPPGIDGPRITLVQRYGYHMMSTSIVLTFDQALDAITAEDAKAYRIIGPASHTIAIKKSVYDPADLTVTLSPVERINVHHTYTLIVDGTSPHGLTNTQGQLLDGADKGAPDSNYVGALTWRNLVLDPVPRGIARWFKQTPGNTQLKSAASDALMPKAALSAHRSGLVRTDWTHFRRVGSIL